MDKTITTALLIVISMVMAMLLFNAAYPAITKSGDAIANMAYRAEDRMKSQVVIIHAAGELDNNGQWQDTDLNGDFDVFVWVKNVGDTAITAIDQIDVFFGPENDFVRIPNQSNADGSYPNWTFDVENAASWTPTATLKIDIHYRSALNPGRYFLKVTTPNGVQDQYFLGL